MTKLILPLLGLLLDLLGHVRSFTPHVRVRTSVTAASSPLFRKSTVSDISDAIETSTSSADYESASAQLGAWMPLGSASSLTGLNPTQIHVCGLDMAVWHKPLPKGANNDAVATEWSAMVDACPHRLAPLSQGRVDPESGCIECPYHGWAYDTDGTLKSLPQLEEGTSIDAATGKSGAATSLPVHAAGDLLFVFLPTDITGESWPISRLPEEHYPYSKANIESGATYFSRDLPYSLDFLLENFMDPAHIPFAHHSLQSTRDDGSPLQMQVLVNNFTHVEFTFQDRCGGKERDGVGSFQRPAMYHYRTRVNKTAEYTPDLLVFCAPIEEGKSRVVLPDFPLGPLPKWLGHLGTNRFLNTDSWLHDVERTARMNAETTNKLQGSVAVGAAKAGRKSINGLNYIVATKADIAPSLFRKWWSKHGFADAPPHTFGPASASSFVGSALSRAEQIDPWLSHAKSCRKCRGALRIMRRLQKVSIATGAIGALLLRHKPPVSIAFVLGGLNSYYFLKKFATAIEGNHYRAEIDDRSVAAIK